jgi:hypothetical protein
MRTHLLVAATIGAMAAVTLGQRPWTRTAEAKSAAAKPAVDPDVVGALHKMGGFLRDQQKFTVRANGTTDDVIGNGQKVEYGGTVELMVRRPDRMRVDLRGDRRDQHFYYDGKTFTVYGERIGYYATFDAPPTLADLKDVLEKRGIDMPLADLFYWGTERDGTKDLTGATSVGVATIEGTACDHYAFRQKDVDWELWIEQGTHPLPRKLVITTTSEKTRPQYAAVLDWDLAPQLTDQVFTFAPPPDAHKIEFEDAKKVSPRR